MLTLFFSFLRRWLCGLQRFLAGIIALLCLSQFDGFEDALPGSLLGYILLVIWAGCMTISGSILLVTNKPAKLQSFWLTCLFLVAFVQFFQAPLVRIWLWPPFPVSLEPVGLVVWFMLPMSFYLCALEIFLPPFELHDELTPVRA